MAGLLLLGGGSAALAEPYVPPPGKVFAGVAGPPASAYIAATGKHPAVYQEFVAWGQYLPGITGDALRARARLMVHITTAYGTRGTRAPRTSSAGCSRTQRSRRTRPSWPRRGPRGGRPSTAGAWPSAP